MPDREKVIYDIERCICHVPDACRDCSHDWSKKDGDVTAIDCMEELMADALALLKEQEETRLIRHYSRPNVYADLWLHCEKCGERVDHDFRPKYCPGCGRAVKWDDNINVS